MSRQDWLVIVLATLNAIQMFLMLSQRRTIDRLWALYNEAAGLYARRIKQLEDQNDRLSDRR